MKLLIQNRGLGYTALIFRVLGWLFLPAVKVVSIADGPAAGALEQAGYSKEMKPQSQRLNTFSRIILLYSLHNKMYFVNNVQKTTNGKNSHMVSLCLSSTFDGQVCSPDLVVLSHQTIGVPCLICYRVAPSLLFSVLSNLQLRSHQHQHLLQLFCNPEELHDKI